MYYIDEIKADLGKMRWKGNKAYNATDLYQVMEGIMQRELWHNLYFIWNGSSAWIILKIGGRRMESLFLVLLFKR